MASTLWRGVRGSLRYVQLVLITVAWGIPLYVVTLAKLAVPAQGWRDRCTMGVLWIAAHWLTAILAACERAGNIRWDVRGVEGLNKNARYMVLSNHKSWVDIIAIEQVLHPRIAYIAFFLKRELLWLPIVGQACWALDFPFMKRHSPEYLAKHPEARADDLETTRISCQKMANKPLNILNFAEGTRFTRVKHDKQESPYRHLLKPKTGGFAFTLSAMGNIFDALLDVTIAYPERIPTMWDLLSGQIREVIVDVRQRRIPPEFFEGDYLGDEDFRARFQAWVHELWQEKDELMEQLLNRPQAQTS